MKKYLGLLLLLPTLALNIYANEWQEVKSSGTTIKLPKEWSVDTEESYVEYTAYSTNEGISNSEYITLSKTDLGIELPANMQKKILESNSETILELYDGSEVVEVGDNYFIVKGSISGVEVEKKYSYYFDKETMYLLTFTANNDNFDEVEEIFEEIESTFTYES